MLLDVKLLYISSRCRTLRKHWIGLQVGCIWEQFRILNKINWDYESFLCSYFSRPYFTKLMFLKSASPKPVSTTSTTASRYFTDVCFSTLFVFNFGDKQINYLTFEVMVCNSFAVSLLFCFTSLIKGETKFIQWFLLAKYLGNVSTPGNIILASMI